jgi:hypothetical protein
VLGDLLKIARIGMGVERVKVFKVVKTKTKLKGGGFEEKVATVELEVTEFNLPAANRALELYGKATGIPFDGSAPDRDPTKDRRHIPMTAAQLEAYARTLAEEMRRQEQEAGAETIN